MAEVNDPRVTWNLFVSSLQSTKEAWEKHREVMSTLGVQTDDPKCRELVYDFWRSPFEKMIDRFLGFYHGWNFRDLRVDVPKETKDEEKGGKKK